MTPDDVIHFWHEAGPNRWFWAGATFDGMIATRFGGALAEARNGAFADWEVTPLGALALTILLDQFSRNIHRGTPLAFAADHRALALVRFAISRNDHHAFPAPLAQWFVMPFEHAEDLDAQRRAVALFQTMGLAEMVHWARIHLDVIARFGRFPHRNKVLGRPSRPDELAFLAGGGFSG
jgi:uncharacterized protein (DUF924 family)